MNATATEKVYSIVAAYYNGDQLVEEKVLKEIKMAPGTDGIETDIVKLENGQTVRIYARNDSKPDSENPGAGQPGDPTQNQKNKLSNTVVLVVIIVGVIAFVALVIVAVMIVLKKPAAKEEKKEETQE